MDDKQSAQMQVIESAPGFIAIKHKMGCPICDSSALHCMAAKQTYEIHLAEDYNALKDSFRSVKKKADEPTIKNLSDQVQSLEKQLQETKDNSAELSNHKELILENKHLQEELEYYQGNTPSMEKIDIPVSDDEDDNEDLTGLPTIPEEIPQDILSHPPTRLARPLSTTTKNAGKSIPEAGIPALGDICTSAKQKRIIADPLVSITGVLPKPLGKVRAERWDQPALRGASDWVMETDVHDSDICRLYIEGRALQPHEQTPDHTAVIFRTDEYARSLSGLPKDLVAHHDDPNWMENVIQTFNVNSSGIQ
ncbi:hypothetical protein M422DRAFT_273518 [Sphaerobolus stellatus SS14]|uniref:Uncharacterized protein n=1 Tax=Sphaerobolus stellatus (strain SS14) TaxID=990650 RepID=A0A0C9UJF5_SPHS4|nr:hypothetical protein M422DRAFT_273518 [Sphaerobolus stellatus SS14]